MLVFINALFVAAEFSFVRIRQTRLEELAQQNDEKASLLLKMAGELDTYLSATQLGITASSLALGWMGEPAVVRILGPFIQEYMPFIPAWVMSPLAVALSFSVITFLQIVLGELVPRNIALQKVELIALNLAKPINLFYHLIYPVVRFFNASARAILSVFGMNAQAGLDSHTQEEIRMIISKSEEGGVIDSMRSQILDNVFEFTELMAREVMVPRQDIVCLYLDASFEDNLKTVRENVHTRYPLCKGDKDNIIGVVHIRGILDLVFQPPEQQDIMKAMREVLIIPEGMSVANVFQLLQQKHLQMAVVADEYGGTAGIVTFEDLIEEIVGDIQDEYDQEDDSITEHADGSYEFDGLMLIGTVEDTLGIELSEHDEDTIGGYIFGILGRRPEIGDIVEECGYRFTVIKVKGFRVQRLKAEKQDEPDEQEHLSG